MDVGAAVAQTKKFSEIVKITRGGNLALVAEYYPEEFVRFFPQLYEIAQKMLIQQQQQQQQQPNTTARRLNFNDATMAGFGLCPSCGLPRTENYCLLCCQ